MSVNKLTKAIMNMPPPPCAECFQAERCAEEELACIAFARYANTGYNRDRRREPTRGHYLRQFPKRGGVAGGGREES